MFNLTDIHPLTSFLRDHKTHIERLEKTGRAEVLTVNGKSSVVIQDVEAYQKLLDELHDLRTERILRDRLARMDRGEPGIPAEEVLADLRNRLGIKKKRSA